MVDIDATFTEELLYVAAGEPVPQIPPDGEDDNRGSTGLIRLTALPSGSSIFCTEVARVAGRDPAIPGTRLYR